MKKHFSFRQMPNVFTTVSRHCNGGRTGVGIDVNSPSPHSSKRGLGKVSTLILLFALSFGFSSQAWGTDSHFCLGGEPINGQWSRNTTYKIGTGYGENNKYYIVVYMKNGEYFCLYQENAGNNETKRYCPDNDVEVQPGNGGSQGSLHENNNDCKAWKYVGETGYVKVCIDVDNNKEYNPYVWVEKYQFLTDDLKDVLKGNKVQFYFGDQRGDGWRHLFTKSGHNSEDRAWFAAAVRQGSCFVNNTDWGSFRWAPASVASVNYYLSDNDSGWDGLQIGESAVAGKAYMLYNRDNVTIAKGDNRSGASFNNASSTITRGTSASGLSATLSYPTSVINATNSIKYYITSDNFDNYNEFDPTNASGLDAGTYTVAAVVTDGNIYVKAATATLTVTEPTYSVTINNGDHGTVSPNGAQQVGASGMNLTVTPNDCYYHTGWNTTGGASVSDNKVTATATGSVTALYSERWVLRGSKKNSAEKGGMPTDDATGLMATINEGVASIAVTLAPNCDYQFTIYDKKNKSEKGQTYTATIEPMDQEESLSHWKLDNSNPVYLATAGYGQYTIYAAVDDDCPKVYYSAPESYQITMDTKAFSGETIITPPEFGTLTAKTTENATDFDVTTGQYVREGGSIVFTATPAEGYSFAGFYSDENCETLLQEANIGLTYTVNNVTTNKSVYAKFTENLTPVTLRINGDGKVKVNDVEQPASTIFKVGVYTTVTLTTEPSANVQFKGWTKSSGADFTIENNVLKGNGAGLKDGQILTANFGELDKIYFLNNNFNGQYKWNDVYFYWDAYWTDNYGAGAHDTEYTLSRCIHMNHIDGTDIWWAYIPSDFTGTNVAFSQEDMWNYKNFSKYGDDDSHGVFRTDFKKATNMYVPVSGESTNNCYYFSEGYWMKYDPKASEGVGYYLKKKSSADAEASSEDYQFGEFKAITANADGSTTSVITISVDKNTNHYLYVVSAGGENYGDQTTFDKSHKSNDLSKYKDKPNFTLTPSGTGDYTLKLTQGTGTKIHLEIIFPTNDGDYRVIYKKSGLKDHPSHAIQLNDKVSFFVNKEGGKFRIQQFIDGTWTDVTGATNLDVPGTIANDGVYVFQLENDGKSLSNLGAYTGDYYIRTDVAGGGWHDYKGNAKNKMEKGTIYGYENSFDYAYTNWAAKDRNVKYTIANDYSLCISDSLTADNYIGSDAQLTQEGANIRFMWNSKTNALQRDYISGSNNNEDYLVIYGANAETNSTESKLYTEKTGSEPVSSAKFHDDGNWVYSKEFYVEPGAYVALTAKFNDKYQFFYGEGDASAGTINKYASFVGGTTGDKLRMKVIYNFKTNELIAGYIPDGEKITQTIDLSSDLLWVRGMQNAASAINFAQNDLQIKNIKKVYGVLELNKQTMTNLYVGNEFKPLNNSSYDRCLYWISFPFQVKISDIFGIDGYGTKWILQRYRGDLRAKNGWFAETTTFWEYMSASETMNAYEGYVLCLDPDYFDEVTDEVWKNVEQKIAFYFPSANSGEVDITHSASQTVEVPEHLCEIERTFIVNGKELNHTTTDSHWNVIGIPAFEDLTEDIAEGKHIGLKALYEWNSTNNDYSVQATSGTTSYKFEAMKAYMVQFAGNIVWSNASVVKNKVPTPVAPRRLEKTANYMAEIEFHQGNKANDHTYINLAENATTDFMLNEDMMKIDNAGCPNIYSFAGNYNVAYNETSKASQTIDLGVSAPAAGNYKFHMPSDFTGTVTLIDNVEQTRTNLQVQDYELYLDKGTYNDRFQLEINLQSVVTNLDNVFGGQLNSDHAVKFIRDDKMFILRSGSIFDATGKRMK